MKSKNTGEDDEDDESEHRGECPICLEKIGKLDYSITKCGHSFCTSCILKSVAHTGLCPLCRTELTDNIIKKTFIDNKNIIIKRSLDAFGIVERFPDMIEDDKFKHKIVEDFVYFSHLILHNSIDILGNNN